MFREAPMCWLGAEHLACTEVSQLPLVQMWVFITRIVASLLQIALSAVSVQKTFLYLIQCLVYHNEGQKAPWHAQKNNAVWEFLNFCRKKSVYVQCWILSQSVEINFVYFIVVAVALRLFVYLRNSSKADCLVCFYHMQRVGVIGWWGRII